MNEPRSPLQPVPVAPGHPAPAPPRATMTPGATPPLRPPASPAGAAPAMPRPASTIPRPTATPRPAVSPHHAPAPAPAAAPGQHLPQRAAGNTLNPAARPAADAGAIELVDDPDDGDAAAPTPSKIVFGADLAHRKHNWKRQPVSTGNGAVRVKTFHAKLSDQGLEYLDEAINVFIDEHPEVDIKFVTTNVGMFDGKFKDLALVVNVWY